MPKITYPTPHIEVCGYHDNICNATGDPAPRVQLLQAVNNNHIHKLCIAENLYIDESGNHNLRFDKVEFKCEYPDVFISYAHNHLVLLLQGTQVLVVILQLQGT